MHEYYVTEEIIHIACNIASENNSSVISGISVVIGELTGMSSASIQFYFDALSRDTAAAGAKLSFIRQPVSRFCMKCNQEFTGRTELYCPACGTEGITSKTGHEFYVECVELPD